AFQAPPSPQPPPLLRPSVPALPRPQLPGGFLPLPAPGRPKPSPASTPAPEDAAPSAAPAPRTPPRPLPRWRSAASPDGSRSVEQEPGAAPRSASDPAAPLPPAG